MKLFLREPLVHQSALSNELVVDENGNVGVGTTGPVARVDIQDSKTGGGTAGLLVKNSTYGQYLPPSDIRAAVAGVGHYAALANVRSPGIYGWVPTGGHGTLASAAIFDRPDNNRRIFIGGSQTAIAPPSFHVYNTATTATDFIVDYLGNVGIGTKTPGVKLEVNGSIRGNTAGALKVDTGSGYVAIGPQHAGHAHIITDRSNFYFNKRLQVDTGIIGSYDEDLYLKAASLTGIVISKDTGYVGVGTINPQDRLDVAGYVRANGTRLTSDARWKQNIQQLENALDLVTQLRGVSFDWVDPLHGDSEQLGVIAQEVEEVFPQVVYTDSQGYKSVEYNKLVAPRL